MIKYVFYKKINKLKQNLKYIRIHVYEYMEWQAMAPHPIPPPCALTLPPTSHQDATMPSPSPCWAPHFMTQKRLMFSNPTPSEPRLSPATTMIDDMLSALHCVCILQPASPLQIVAF